jgi:predicted aspartyl protease
MGLRRVLAGGVGLFLTAALTSQTNAQESRQRITVSTMQFELISDFVVIVQGQADELGGLRFILDTGSSHTVLDRQVADRLGLQRHPGRVMNFDRYIPVDWADLPEIRVGPIRAMALRVMVVNLAEVSAFGQKADGILGLDLLGRGRKLVIDYEKRLMSVETGPQSEGGAPPPNGFAIPVVVQGVPMRFLVDTGLRDMLIYRERLRGGLPHLRTEGEPKKVMIGRLQATKVSLPGVQIFGRDAMSPVFLIDRPKTDVDAIDGYLGPTSLHAKRLELDFASRVLRWQ